MSAMADLSNVDAERAVLGSVILDPETLDKLGELDASDFTLATHRHVFSALRSMRDQSEPIDEVTLAAKIRGAVDFGEVVDLTQSVVSAANADAYANNRGYQIKDAYNGVH